MKKTYLCAAGVALAPSLLLILSNWGYGGVSIYQALQSQMMHWPTLLYTSCVYTVVGGLMGFLITRFAAHKQRRAGRVAFTIGLLLIVALGAVYAAYDRGVVSFAPVLNSFFVFFDLRELYLWGGLYLMQILCRTSRGAKPQKTVSGEKREETTGAMLCVILLPALLLLVSALAAQKELGAQWRYWEVVLYSVIGLLFGSIPQLCRAERNRLRAAVAVTFGLAGAGLIGMSSHMPAAAAFLAQLNGKEVALWIGMYLWMMGLLLRQGYREKNQNETKTK